ncbi:hypothetical protein [Bremerella sp.]|uniref:hypothetical protein n=1 Tax=Bremerella sp. TaxID=2795602 RepID=UPI00391C9DB6
MPASILRRLSGLFGSSQKRRRVRTQRPIEIRYAETLEDRRMLSATELVADINQQDAIGVYFREGVEFRGYVYYSGAPHSSMNTGSPLGTELWRYDPNANDGAGASELVADISSIGSSSPRHLTVVDGKLFFLAHDSDDGARIWVHDPDANNGQGTTKPISEVISASYFDLVRLGDHLYFTSFKGDGIDLWKLPISASGPSNQVQRVEIPSSLGISDYPDLEVINDKLYFQARPEADEGYALFELDPGANDGLGELKFLHANTKARFQDSPLTVFKGKLYFQATDGTYGNELWEFDPALGSTEQSTRIVGDVSSGSSSSSINHMLVADELLYFSLRSSTQESGLWKYDPNTNEMTNVVSQGFASGFTAAANGKVYFVENSNQVWEYDPEKAEGENLTQIATVTDPEHSAYTQRLFSFFDEIYIPVSPFGLLWRFNSQGEGGPVAAEDYNASSTPYSFISLDGMLYFRADDGIHGQQIWRHNPSAELGSSAVERISLFDPSSTIKQLYRVDDSLYFRMVVSDGDVPVSQIWEFNPSGNNGSGNNGSGNNGSGEFKKKWETQFSIYQMYLMDGDFYLNVVVDTYVHEIWRFDPSADDGQVRVEKITDSSTGFELSYPYRFSPLGQRLLFHAESRNVSRDLWQFDPAGNNGQGTLSLADDVLGTPASAISIINGKYYFLIDGYGYQSGFDLVEVTLATEDEPASRRTIISSVVGYEKNIYFRQIAADGKLFFVREEDATGFELWMYDPLASLGQGQAIRLTDFSNGPASSFPYEFKYWEGMLYFNAFEDHLGNQLWQLNTLLAGQPGSLRRLTSLETSQSRYNSSFGQLEVLDNHLYFASLVDKIGSELFKVPIPNGSTFVDLYLSDNASGALGIVEPIAGGVTLSEWSTPVAQLWVTIGADVSEVPFDLNVTIDLQSTWLRDPSVMSSLGTDVVEIVDDTDGQRTYALTINDIDLSSYEVGDRVLVANIEFPLDPENTTGVPMDGEGSYPAPTTEHGVTLVSAVNASTSEPFDVLPDVSGQFMPMVYDTNDDGKVGLADFAEFISNYGKVADSNSPQAYRLDFNQDGKVGIADFALFISNYGKRKFPPEAQIAQAWSVESEPASRFRATTSSDHLEGESDMSIYWVTTDKLPRASMVDDSFQNEEQDFVESKARQLTCVDTSWDARVIDAAIHEEEFFMTSPKESERDLDESFSAGF